MARAPTPTAATTAAVAMPAHNLLLMPGWPALCSVCGWSVARVLLLPSGEEREGLFMGCPSDVGPVGAMRVQSGTGRIKISLHRRHRRTPEPLAEQDGGIRTPRKYGVPCEGRSRQAARRDLPVRVGPRKPESRCHTKGGHQ